MKKEVIEWIRIKGMGYSEIIVTISVEDVQFDSIEWIVDEDRLVLHKFVENEFDYEICWEDLPADWQSIIYYQLILPLRN